MEHITTKVLTHAKISRWVVASALWAAAATIATRGMASPISYVWESSRRAFCRHRSPHRPRITPPAGTRGNHHMQISQPSVKPKRGNDTPATRLNRHYPKSNISGHYLRTVFDRTTPYHVAMSTHGIVLFLQKTGLFLPLPGFLPSHLLRLILTLPPLLTHP
jgi:hypothetical protein